MKKIVYLLCILSFWAGSCSSKKADPEPQSPDAVDYKATYLLAIDQSQNRIARIDLKTQTVIWEWKAATGVPATHVAWFSNISEGKPVYNGKYILITASGGGVALVRVSDKATVFYCYVGGNTHSAEVLPDGNIVAASSTGDILTLINVNLGTFPDNVYKKTLVMEDAHNVVWDKQRQVLWSASKNKLIAYAYNFNCKAPDLSVKESITLPASGCHDLFPVYGKDELWLSTSTKAWVIDMKTKAVIEASALPRIKSVSSGPNGYPVVTLQGIDTDKQWYNDKVQDLSGKTIFQMAGLKMYKARWELKNEFSYPANDEIKTCN
ncbi:hypothetical protein ABIE26_002408 [Pedobacter africanus]|uniref:Uncharacterized protein n=1 Tax=Pedobacter africanus TaxID=151894 RepID=A0ACC6KYN3_9SPHI|nr:DUF6528 family protein [Pedobacter africanus]MDR6784203.1 hypothetical protein [Pedobacter africanus]